MQHPTRTVIFVHRATKPIVFVIASIAITVILFLEHHTQSALFFALTFSATMVINTILKYSLKVPRPANARITLHDPAFPSGHCAASVSFALLVTYISRISTEPNMLPSVMLLWVVAFCIIASRLYMRVHTKTQVFAGILVGALVPLLAIFFFSPF